MLYTYRNIQKLTSSSERWLEITSSYPSTVSFLASLVKFCASPTTHASLCNTPTHIQRHAVTSRTQVSVKTKLCYNESRWKYLRNLSNYKNALLLHHHKFRMTFEPNMTSLNRLLLKPNQYAIQMQNCIWGI
jgi:hypothetical protein